MAVMEKLTFAEVCTEMKALVAQEEDANLMVSEALWKQGDLIKASDLTDKEMGKLAQQVRRSKATLYKREKVAKAWPPELRKPTCAWGVHEALLRLGDNEEERVAVLSEKPDWTIEEMSARVSDILKLQAGGTGVAVVKRVGAKMDGVHVVLAKTATDEYEITVTSPPSVFKTHDIGARTFVVVVRTT